MRSILLQEAREREQDHLVPETVVASVVETIFRETALITSHHAKATSTKANRASHSPRVLAKARAKTVRNMETENPKESIKIPSVPTVRTK